MNTLDNTKRVKYLNTGTVVTLKKHGATQAAEFIYE